MTLWGNTFLSQLDNDNSDSDIENFIKRQW